MPRPSGHATRDSREIEDPYDLPLPTRTQLLADAADAMITEPPDRAVARGKP
jgi:hypothetical protein